MPIRDSTNPMNNAVAGDIKGKKQQQMIKGYMYFIPILIACKSIG